MAAKKNWIQGMHMKKGAFTAKAKNHGMTPAEFQAMVLAHPTMYDETTVRQARLRKTLVRMH